MTSTARTNDDPDDPFDGDPWALRETRLDLDGIGRSESLFALANGHIGLRGNLDEGEPRGLSGTYLNGFYESYPLAYGERGFGFAEDGQSVVDVTDGKVMRLLVEDEPLDVERGTLEEHVRCLDLKTGVLRRDLVWRSAYGHRVRVRSERLVSFTKRSVAAIRYEVEALDEPLKVTLQSNLLVNQGQADLGADDPRASQGPANALAHELFAAHDRRVVLCHRTRRTELRVSAGMDHVCTKGGDGLTEALHAEDDLGRYTVSTELKPGEPLCVEKVLSYHWSSRQTPEFLRDQVDASLDSALSEGFDGLAAEQAQVLDEFWKVADVEIVGDDEVQQAMRFAMFHLLQATTRAEERAIAAKGLTGAGYDGHAFWDTECFVLPVMTYTQPKVVRDALIWRASTLGQARERAAQLGLKGAAFPWRTIHGEECSGYWPAGTAAVHVNADIAGAVIRYVEATGDDEFERAVGTELLVETARLWCSLGRMAPDGKFRIDGVTGPDEYSALVDNNVFTNLMAQANLLGAVAAVDRHPGVAEHLGVRDEEVATWREAGERMYVPYDEERGLHPQDEDYLLHEPWDFEHTAEDQYPLMLHFPYFQLYRKQVVKQADLVLAMHMRGDHFTQEEKRRNFDYYETITVRDSSLSACTQAAVAADVGHLDLAWDYLREAALMDLKDLAKNTSDGLHIASLAGAVIAAVSGLGGFRAHHGHLAFRPRLPRAIERLAFGIWWRGERLRVEVDQAGTTYRVTTSGQVELRHWDHAITVGADPITLEIPDPPDEETPAQPPHREPRARARRAG